MQVTLTSRIPQVRGRVKANVGRAVKTAVFKIEARAKMRSPVDTGFLRSSIQGDMTGDMQGVVNVSAHYGVFVELGTVKMSAQPFFTPAIEETRPEFLRDVARAVDGGAR